MVKGKKCPFFAAISDGCEGGGFLGTNNGFLGTNNGFLGTNNGFLGTNE